MHAYQVVSNSIREIKGQSLLAWPGPSKFLTETYLLEYTLPADLFGVIGHFT
jgi:hypothetical protein